MPASVRAAAAVTMVWASKRQVMMSRKHACKHLRRNCLAGAGGERTAPIHCPHHCHRWRQHCASGWQNNGAKLPPSAPSPLFMQVGGCSTMPMLHHPRYHYHRCHMKGGEWNNSAKLLSMPLCAEVPPPQARQGGNNAKVPLSTSPHAMQTRGIMTVLRRHFPHRRLWMNVCVTPLAANDNSLPFSNPPYTQNRCAPPKEGQLAPYAEGAANWRMVYYNKCVELCNCPTSSAKIEVVSGSKMLKLSR